MEDRISFSKCIGNILGKYLEDTSSFAGTFSRKCHLRGEAQSINSVMRMSFSKCIGNRLGKYLEDTSSFAATLSQKCHLRGNFFCNFVPKMFYPKIFCSQKVAKSHLILIGSSLSIININIGFCVKLCLKFSS